MEDVFENKIASLEKRLTRKITPGAKMTEAVDQYDHLISKLLQGDYTDLACLDVSDRFEFLFPHILTSKRLSEEDLKTLVSILVTENTYNDAGTQFCLGFLAARAGLFREAVIFARALLDGEYVYASAIIVSKSLSQKHNKNRRNFEELMRQIEATGHYYARLMLLKWKFKKFGIFGLVPMFICRIPLAFRAGFTEAKNPYDKRVEKFSFDQLLKEFTEQELESVS